jgi:lipopolysaccharide/colanic/teichoic acid biosynthesis glycosyltransferase
MTPSHQPGRTRTGARGHERPGRRRHILDEDLFRRVLTRERYRSDRSGRPFVLLLVAVRDDRAPDSSSRGDAAILALTAATRATDVAGWYAGRAVMGVIVSEIGAADPLGTGEAIEARFGRELAKWPDADTASGVSIRLHVYPEPRRPGEKAFWPLDRPLYPELRPRRARWTVYDASKRGLDIFGSATLLLLLSPLLVLIAALVKWSSSGSVLFRQERIGHAMKPYSMLKFRTMHSGADSRLHHEFVSSFIKARGQVHDPGKNEPFKLTNDPRVTPLGRALRSTSLDELPQLWNVLRGDMSLVGPRPPLPYELEHYEPWHRRRVLEAKPGITGLWQVVGRSRTTFDEMVRLDLRYVRTRSLWTDIRILLATPAAVVSGKGAW